MSPHVQRAHVVDLHVLVQSSKSPVKSTLYKLYNSSQRSSVKTAESRASRETNIRVARLHVLLVCI